MGTLEINQSIPPVRSPSENQKAKRRANNNAAYNEEKKWPKGGGGGGAETLNNSSEWAPPWLGLPNNYRFRSRATAEEGKSGIEKEGERFFFLLLSVNDLWPYNYHGGGGGGSSKVNDFSSPPLRRASARAG